MLYIQAERSPNENHPVSSMDIALLARSSCSHSITQVNLRAQTTQTNRSEVIHDHNKRAMSAKTRMAMQQIPI